MDRFPVFTTTPSTLYGVTFLVIAPDHDLYHALLALISIPKSCIIKSNLNQ